MLFWQFSNIIIYVKIVGKIPDQQLNVWLISNPGDKFQILVDSTGQIRPVVLHLFWTLSPGFENNHTFKCWSVIFPTTLTYMIMLENCQNKISVYGCSPIQGTKYFFLLKFHESRISDWNIISGPMRGLEKNCTWWCKHIDKQTGGHGNSRTELT